MLSLAAVASATALTMGLIGADTAMGEENARSGSGAGVCKAQGAVVMNPPGGGNIGAQPDFAGQAGAKLTTSILSLVMQARAASKGREDFVKNMVDEVNKTAGPGYNVVVADIRHDPDDVDPNGRPLIDADIKGKPDAMFDVEYCQDWDGTKHTYRTWIFDSEAQFSNSTDGGWMNWGFSGVYDVTDATEPEQGGYKSIHFRATPERNSLEHLKPRTLTYTEPGGTEQEGVLNPTGTNPRELVSKENEDRITVEDGGDLVQKVPHIYNKDLETLAEAPGRTRIRWTTFARPIQRWTFVPDGDRFKIVSEETGGAMHLAGDGFSAPKTVSAATGGDATWELRPESDGYFSLRDDKGDCLEQPIPNSTLSTATCDGSDKQQWKLDGYATQSF
jgi:hypothetical protein